MHRHLEPFDQLQLVAGKGCPQARDAFMKVRFFQTKHIHRPFAQDSTAAFARGILCPVIVEDELSFFVKRGRGRIDIFRNIFAFCRPSRRIADQTAFRIMDRDHDPVNEDRSAVIEHARIDQVIGREMLRAEKCSDCPAEGAKPI